MTNAWISLSRLNADFLALAASAMDLGWTLLVVGAAWPFWAPASLRTDLVALGLDRMPSTTDELRRAYRRAVKSAHPDAGGSADAFRAVTEAFGRLSERLAVRTA
jgi:hypothetical protein